MQMPLLNIIRVLDIVYGLIEKKTVIASEVVFKILMHMQCHSLYIILKNICSGTRVSICIINIIINHWNLQK